MVQTPTVTAPDYLTSMEGKSGIIDKSDVETVAMPVADCADNVVRGGYWCEFADL